MKASSLSRSFLHASQSGDLSSVEALVSEHSVTDWTGFRHPASGDTGLHVAAREGHLNVVRFLCEHFEGPRFKADVANRDTKTPLHEAAQFARSEVLEYLLAKGADVDSLKRADWTPLMLACTKTGREACKCVSILLENNANASIRNKDGWTAFLVACRSGDENMLDILVKHAPNCVNDRSNNGRSALHIAAFHGHEGVIDLLVSADRGLVSARDSSGSTPLHEAVKSGHLSTVNRLIELGADPRAVDNVGQTILHVAALTGNVEIIEYILKNCEIDVDAEASFGVTPLVAARRGGHADVVECLMKHGAKQ